LSAGAITVVVPVRDGERYLAEALASVRGEAIAEIVVVDDGSTDATAEVARADRRVRYLRQEPSGVSAARNRGVRAAASPLVGFLDADDLWSVEPGADPRLAALEEDPALDGVFARAQLFRDAGRGRELGPTYPTHQLGAGLFRRPLFERAGLFDETLAGGEDLEWYLRARDAGARIASLAAVTLLYRRHAANMTFDDARTRGFLLAALGRSIRRRRS
jgi:glycosyltransferase involved in cell wall biosynthesis